MKRIEQIGAHPLFQKCLREIDDFERERIYCGHGLAHLLDVARIAYILNLEAGGGLPKALIYAAALLHDVGRAEQYKGNGPHEEVGAEIAAEILRACDFTADESAVIVQAIRGHRGDGPECEATNTEEALPAAYIRRADKMSRRCDSCAAVDLCDWPPERKNLKITI